MQMRHEIDGRILIIHQNGVTEPQEIGRAMAAALADPGLQADSRLLWNATDAPAQASADKMQNLLSAFRGADDRLPSRWAFLVSNELQYGVSRMFAVYSESVNVEVEVFYDEDSAKAWLLE